MGLLISLVVYGAKTVREEYGSPYEYYPQVRQLTPEWCFYAVLEMLHRGPQIEIATEYQKFISNLNGTDPTINCNIFPMQCGGVSYKYVVDFWNTLMSDNKNYIAPFELTYQIGSSYYLDKELPRLGILRQDEWGYPCLHAILIYYIEIFDRTVNFTTTDYDVRYIDPWDGTAKQKRATGVFSYKPLNIYIEILEE